MIVAKASLPRLLGLFRGEALRARSLRASTLVFGAFGVDKALQLGSNLILTRVLFPEAFGLMALVSAFIAGLNLMSDIGIQPSLVRSRRSADPAFQATAWSLQVVRGFWITGLAWLLAWPYAQLYDEALLFPLVCVSGMGAAITGFKSVQMALHQRDLILGRVLALQLLNHAVGVALTVAFAWWLQSVWGLAIGGVLGALSATLMSHLLFPSPNHRFVWDRSVLKEIAAFGRWILLGTLFTYLGGRGMRLVQGYFVELDTLAYLHIAGLFAWAIGDLSGKVLGSVAFPGLAKVVRERPKDLGRIVHRIHRLQLLVTIPAFILLAVVARPLIDLLYDDRYAVSGLFLAFMALNGAFGVLPTVYQNAMLAIGDSRIHAAVMGLSSALKIAANVAGFLLGGPIGMIIGAGVANLLVFAFSAVMAARRGFADLAADAAALAAILGAYAILLVVLL